MIFSPFLPVFPGENALASTRLTDVQLSQPSGIVLEEGDHLYVVDSGNKRVSRALQVDMAPRKCLQSCTRG